MGLNQMQSQREQMMATLTHAPDIIDSCLKGLIEKEGAMSVISQFLALAESTSILDIIAKAASDTQKYAYTLNASFSCFEAAPVN